jgi:hypothetical protein
MVHQLLPPSSDLCVTFAPVTFLALGRDGRELLVLGVGAGGLHAEAEIVGLVIDDVIAPHCRRRGEQRRISEEQGRRCSLVHKLEDAEGFLHNVRRRFAGDTGNWRGGGRQGHKCSSVLPVEFAKVERSSCWN